jgi:hypothetical protein
LPWDINILISFQLIVLGLNKKPQTKYINKNKTEYTCDTNNNNVEKSIGYYVASFFSLFSKNTNNINENNNDNKYNDGDEDEDFAKSELGEEVIRIFEVQPNVYCFRNTCYIIYSSNIIYLIKTFFELDFITERL